MKRFVQYYDENYNELCGSDGVWVFDQRWTNNTVIIRVTGNAERQAEYYEANPDKAVPQRAASFRIMMGEILNSRPMTGFIDLKHN